MPLPECGLSGPRKTEFFRGPHVLSKVNVSWPPAITLVVDFSPPTAAWGMVKAAKALVCSFCLFYFGEFALGLMNPISYLPPRLAYYARFPVFLSVIWIGFALYLCSLKAVPRTAEYVATGADSASSSSSTQILEVRGVNGFRFMRSGHDLVVESDRSGRSIIRSDVHGNYVLTSSAGQVVATMAAFEDGGFELRDAQGSVHYKLKPEDDEIKIKAMGNTLFRIKIKEEKFNLYGQGDQRMFHGKLKNGEIVVRTENDADAMHIAFSTPVLLDKQLRLSALLSLPLEQEYRVLACGGTFLTFSPG